MISREFIEFWEPRYDKNKYSVDFYLSHSEKARNAQLPEILKEELLALLHWKDGKTSSYVPGEYTAKPNTINPVHELENSKLVEFTGAFHNLVKANESEIRPQLDIFRAILSKMWDSVVIPAFILHITRPDFLPIIDQHTVRAFLALTRGEIINTPRITWDLWSEYVEFFKKAAVNARYDNDLVKRYSLDRALFAWGKLLKRKGCRPPSPPPPPPPPPGGNPQFWGQQVPTRGIVPPSCNVLKALKDYLDLGTLDSLPLYKKQNLRDLHFHQFPQSELLELLQRPGENRAEQFLRHYKEDMGGGNEIAKLPRPIRDTFLFGWTTSRGIRGATNIAKYLHSSGYGGTRNAAGAIVYVGKTTGRLFGLLDESDTPTHLFSNYFKTP